MILSNEEFILTKIKKIVKREIIPQRLARDKFEDERAKLEKELRLVVVTKPSNRGSLCK